MEEIVIECCYRNIKTSDIFFKFQFFQYRVSETKKLLLPPVILEVRALRAPWGWSPLVSVVLHWWCNAYCRQLGWPGLTPYSFFAALSPSPTAACGLEACVLLWAARSPRCCRQPLPHPCVLCVLWVSQRSSSFPVRLLQQFPALLPNSPPFR